MMFVIVEEVAQAHDREVREEAQAEEDWTFEALSHIMPKALLISREILCLLKGGYPDGALTRWRTLHELSVIAVFLRDKPSEIALRYLASFDFRALRAAREYNKYSDRSNMAPFSDEELKQFEDRAACVEQQIGDRLKKDYDWAYPALREDYPTLKADRVDFSHIERVTRMDHWRPRFRWASLHIHPGHRPTGKLLGQAEAREVVSLVGPSNSGFVDPIHMTAISLTTVAFAFVMTHPNLDRIVVTDIIRALSDEIGPLAVRVERETYEAAVRERASSDAP
jgi:hypothetical protein